MTAVVEDNSTQSSMLEGGLLGFALIDRGD